MLGIWVGQFARVGFWLILECVGLVSGIFLASRLVFLACTSNKFGWGRECSGESSRDLAGRADARLVWLSWWPSAAWRSDTDGGREIE